MTIIPALDIIDGNAVRLTGGDYEVKKVYYKNALEAALMFDDAGFGRLHLVDLDGAKNRRVVNLKVLETISSKTSLQIDFGGGVSTLEDVQAILNAGASQCTVGSIAARSPALFKEWISETGAEKFLVGADVLHERIRVSGWLEDGGISLFEFLEMMIQMGLKEFFCTDIAKDGMMKGPALNLYKKILEKFPDIFLIASGGITSMEDVLNLERIGCNGAIIGKAIYEKSLSLEQLARFK